MRRTFVLFLLKNGIRPHFHRITGESPYLSSVLSMDEFSAKDELDSEMKMVLILTARKSGSYPNVNFQGLRIFFWSKKLSSLGYV